jgi:transglutaminase-like putative cysteine protease
MDPYLSPTAIIDSDHPEVRRKVEEATKDSPDEREMARRLFYVVRDGIRYNPFVARYAPEHFRASATLARGEGFCIQKAVLLAAMSRAAGIPARLGFAVIRNHQIPERLSALLRSNELPDHGYTELSIGGKWVKATPAFDLETCKGRGIVPVEFDGEQDARFHPCTVDGRPHIEYVEYHHGHYADLPLDEITVWLRPALTPEAAKLILGVVD